MQFLAHSSNPFLIYSALAGACKQIIRKRKEKGNGTKRGGESQQETGTTHTA